MTAFRIAAQTRCFAQPFRKALHIAASLECDGVQIDARGELRAEEITQTGLRQLRKILDDLNLRVGSFVFPTRHGYGEPRNLDRRVEATLAAMEMASRLHARVIVLHLGELAGDAPEAHAAMLRDVLGTLASHGMRLGVKIAAQAGFSTCAQVADFVAGLPDGSIYLDLHPVHLMAAGHSPLEFVAAVGRHIAHVHAVDAVRDFATGRSIEVELGRGSADFPALLGQLEEFEYREWVTIERTGSDDTITDVGNAVKFLRSL